MEINICNINIHNKFVGIKKICSTCIVFWTGSNPLAMVDGQEEIQIVEHQGTKYKITATKNKFEIKHLTGEAKGDIHLLTFDSDYLCWVNTTNGFSTELMQYEVENGEMISITFFGAEGKIIEFDAAQINYAHEIYALKE